MHVIATAGHVDHGKSTLVRALCGTDPDRLEEEKRRGLTIDLGFAETTLRSGAQVAFVDVPGHVNFLRNMISGLGGISAVLFVVAASEGWKPQSEEHLRILDLLGAPAGLIALTHCDRAASRSVSRVREEVCSRVAGTFLEPAEIVEVAAPAGIGVSELESALDRMVSGLAAPPDGDRPRLWVDRSFSIKGAGTVVTGTLTGGALQLGDELQLLPACRGVRVRGLQSFGVERQHVPPGDRVAARLSGVEHTEIARGDVLITPGRWHPARTVDASLTVLASLDHPVSRRGAYVAFLGSGAFPVEIRILGAARLEPGARGMVRMRLPVELPLLPGDRYVLRESGRSETVGGGELLDIDPVLPPSRARPDRRVERVVAERGWITTEHLERLTGVRVEATVGGWVVDPRAWAEATERIRQEVAAAGPLGLELARLDDQQRAVAGAIEGVTIEGGRARFEASGDPLSGDLLSARLRECLFSPPALERQHRAVLRELARRGEVVCQDGIWFAADAAEEAARVAAALLAEAPAGFKLAELRDALGTSRRYALALAELLDARGITRRRGDVRVAGPRLPEL